MSSESGLGDDADMEDPRKMAQHMRRMQRDMGEDSTPEFEQMLEQMESGDLDAGDMGDDLDE
jgi:hypothetical protein